MLVTYNIDTDSGPREHGLFIDLAEITRITPTNVYYSQIDHESGLSIPWCPALAGWPLAWRANQLHCRYLDSRKYTAPVAGFFVDTNIQRAYPVTPEDCLGDRSGGGMGGSYGTVGVDVDVWLRRRPAVPQEDRPRWPALTPNAGALCEVTLTDGGRDWPVAGRNGFEHFDTEVLADLWEAERAELAYRKRKHGAAPKRDKREPLAW